MTDRTLDELFSDDDWAQLRREIERVRETGQGRLALQKLFVELSKLRLAEAAYGMSLEEIIMGATGKERRKMEEQLNDGIGLLEQLRRLCADRGLRSV
jgi:hypothetical protein